MTDFNIFYGVNVLVAYLLICIFFVFGAMCGYSGKLVHRVQSIEYREQNTEDRLRSTQNRGHKTEDRGLITEYRVHSIENRI